MQVKAELSKILKDLGYTYRIHRKPVNWEIGPGVNGWFDEYKRRISIYVCGKEGHSHILFVLAHETRHAMHVSENLYRSYYGLNNKLIELFIKGSNVQWRWPNLGVAVRAERDCDKWALKFLKDRGLEYTPIMKYPFTSTASYSVHVKLKSHLRKLEHERTKKDRLLQLDATADLADDGRSDDVGDVCNERLDDSLLSDQR